MEAKAEDLKKARVEALIIYMIYECKTAEQKAIVLQSFIQKYGPIPDEYGDKIKEMLRGG